MGGQARGLRAEGLLAPALLCAPGLEAHASSSAVPGDELNTSRGESSSVHRLLFSRPLRLTLPDVGGRLAPQSHTRKTAVFRKKNNSLTLQRRLKARKRSRIRA